MDVDVTKPVRFGSVAAVATFAGFCIWLGGQVTEVRRDIGELKGKRVYTLEEVRDVVDKRVDERWKEKRPALRFRCDQFPSRGVYAGCTEAP
jgi:hypothetical protein